MFDKRYIEADQIFDKRLYDTSLRDHSPSGNLRVPRKRCFNRIYARKDMRRGEAWLFDSCATPHASTRGVEGTRKSVEIRVLILVKKT